MKIAFLTPEYPHPKIGNSGGIGTNIFNLAKGLVASGNEVVLLIYGQNEDERFYEKGITYYRIKNRKIKGFSRYLTQKKIQKLINNLVEKNEIDIVEAPDWTGFSSNIKPNCPLVIRLNGSDTYFCHLDQRPVKAKNKLFERKALLNADGFISVSKFTADVTNTLFDLKIDFSIIPNCIDTSRFVLATVAETSENTILYFGTLIRKKGLLELPLIFNEVVKSNPEAKLILIGRDSADIISGQSSTWELMKTLFDTAAFKNVTYNGSVAYEEILQHINKATVCVFPTFAEALPVSWIEAMALEKPIVASNIGWATEVIEDSSEGFLVAPKNHIEFAAKIVKLLENEDLRTKFGKNARKKVTEKFSIEVVAKQSLEFYESQLS